MNGKGQRPQMKALVDMGSDKKKPTIPEVLPLIKEYYKTNLAGGNLHIVLDDGNTNNSHLYYCLEQAKSNSDLLGVQIIEALLLMSNRQRRKICRTRNY
jgi:hypothetical protein